LKELHAGKAGKACAQHVVLSADEEATLQSIRRWRAALNFEKCFDFKELAERAARQTGAARSALRYWGCACITLGEVRRD
jgi:hypothetical protein